MDDRLRALERAAESDPAAAVELLWARVRSGQLGLEQARLAALCGDAAARAALGKDAPKPPPPGPSLFVGALAPWGKPAFVRAALAAAARVAHLCPPAELGEWPREALSAVATWVACPCAEHEAEAARLTLARPHLSNEAAQALGAALSMAAAASRTAFARQAAFQAELALARERLVEDPPSEVDAVIRGALRAWALGLADPAAALVAPGPDAFAAPAGPLALPRVLERTGQGAFWLDAQRDLVWDDGGRDRPLGPLRLPPGTRARCFAASRSAEVVAWAQLADDAASVVVRRRESHGAARAAAWSTRALEVEGGLVVDLAVSPSAERLVWTVSPGDGPDALWHLDLRRAHARPERVPLEHAVARALHFPTHCAVGFVTDRDAWEASAPEARTTTLLERVLVRMAMLP